MLIILFFYLMIISPISKNCVYINNEDICNLLYILCCIITNYVTTFLFVMFLHLINSNSNI